MPHHLYLQFTVRDVGCLAIYTFSSQTGTWDPLPSIPSVHRKGRRMPRHLSRHWHFQSLHEENGMCVSNLIYIYIYIYIHIHMFVFESVHIHSQAWLFVWCLLQYQRRICNRDHVAEVFCEFLVGCNTQQGRNVGEGRIQGRTISLGGPQQRGDYC
jgi:hypothetical protein